MWAWTVVDIEVNKENHVICVTYTLSSALFIPTRTLMYLCECCESILKVLTYTTD